MSLVEIPRESLKNLRDKFQVDWPTHIAAYSLLDNYISRLEKNKKSGGFGKVYGLDGSWNDDGTFIAEMFPREIFFATLDPSFRNLKTALKLFKYSAEMTVFMCVRTIYRPVVYEVIQEENLHVLFDDGTVMKILKKEDAKQFVVEIPENFQLRPLTIEDAIKVNSVWPHRSEGSEKLMEYLIENNTNVGLFNETGELVAWCLQHDFGSLAVLQVDENHWRKGYGEIVTKAICKKIAEEFNIDINTNIIHANVKSKNLFEKLGFKEIDTNIWIGALKKEEEP